jgi:hypothetical protein
MISAFVFSTTTILPLDFDIVGSYFYSLALGMSVYAGMKLTIIFWKNYTGGDW